MVGWEEAGGFADAGEVSVAARDAEEEEEDVERAAAAKVASACSLSA